MIGVELIAAQLADKPVLRRLMELYRYDATDFDDSDVDAHGEYGYRYLDHYWTEPDRQPFLIKFSGQLAGFALVNTYSVLGREGVHSIAEFFVMRKYRRRGVGGAVARELLARYPGAWEIVQEDGNSAARAFWAKAVKDCAGGGVESVAVQSQSGLIHVLSFVVSA